MKQHVDLRALCSGLRVSWENLFKRSPPLGPQFPSAKNEEGWTQCPLKFPACSETLSHSTNSFYLPRHLRAWRPPWNLWELIPVESTSCVSSTRHENSGSLEKHDSYTNSLLPDSSIQRRQKGPGSYAKHRCYWEAVSYTGPPSPPDAFYKVTKDILDATSE